MKLIQKSESQQRRFHQTAESDSRFFINARFATFCYRDDNMRLVNAIDEWAYIEISTPRVTISLTREESTSILPGLTEALEDAFDRGIRVGDKDAQERASAIAAIKREKTGR